MTIWYSRKLIGLGRLREKEYYRFTADQVGEFRALHAKLKNYGVPRGFYPETCKIGLEALSRQSGRPILHVHRSLLDRVCQDFEVIEVPDGYLEVQIYRLKREYVRLDPTVDVDEDERVLRYFRGKFASLLKELKLGKMKPDGEREPPDVIRNPDLLDDTEEGDDPDYVKDVRFRIARLKILNSQLENLDRGQQSPLNLTKLPSEKELTKGVRKAKRNRKDEPEVGSVIEPPRDSSGKIDFRELARQRGWKAPTD